MIRIISVEGNIGSGKSTFLKYVQEECKDEERIMVLPEPVGAWETLTDNNGDSIIKLFYQDKRKYAFPFQMMAYISRLALLQNAISALQTRGGGIIICERSLLCDRYVFASMLRDADDINEVEFSIYEKWFNHFMDSLPRHYMFYLRTDPETALTRVKRRKRTGENIQLSYLKTCHDYHEQWLQCPNVLTVNANEEKGISVYKRWLNLLLRAELSDQKCVSASV